MTDAADDAFDSAFSQTLEFEAAVLALVRECSLQPCRLFVRQVDDGSGYVCSSCGREFDV